MAKLGDTEFRAKADPDAHRTLSLMALATKRDLGDLVRDAVDLYIKTEIEKAHSYKVMLRVIASEGAATESTGKT